MLPLPVFDYHRPQTLSEALDLLGKLGEKARIIAGGTDVLPNMKQGLFDPEHVISIARLSELRGISIESQTQDEPQRLVIGAGMRLSEIEAHPDVERAAPALAQAASLVGGPHHRAMGTLGGNICLDTRCRYYNQTYFWRKSLGFCLKKDGTLCHVVQGGRKCVAAASNDTAPALIALGATIHTLGPKGERRIFAGDFYTADGIQNTVLEPGELVVRVSVPIQKGRKSSFEKLRKRGAIDFPLLSIAARIDEDPQNSSNIISADLVVSALGARPRRIRAASQGDILGAGRAQLPGLLADAAYAECKPLSNIDEDTEWRREMVRVLSRKALKRILHNPS